MTEPATVDLGLSVPISGVQLIEASAGTGKTFTLATLYTRLVIEQRLPVSAVLAVTFTEAATRELRGRLRGRLVVARDIAEAFAKDAPPELDESVAYDHRLTLGLVASAVAVEGAKRLLRRLRLACEQMDLAPIHTIHGFCRRALSDHALEAGQPLLDRELLENETHLRRETALAFWRENSRDPGSAHTLLSLWKSPDKLAGSLRDLLDVDVLLPPAGPIDAAPLAALATAREKLANQFAVHGDSARELLRAATLNGDVNGAVSKDDAVDPVWQALRTWAQGDRSDDPAPDKLGRYSNSALKDKTNKSNKRKQPGATPASPVFDAIEAWQRAWDAAQQVSLARRIAMVQAVREFSRIRLQRLKDDAGLLGYDDMIRGVADALEGEGGERFAARLRAQFPVALLDEFQDTDPRQWMIFRRLFGDGVPDADDAPVRALFLIGDPKQAIYRFRGGDVFTYLDAETAADAKHLLDRNFRSRPAMLQAVEALFTLSGDDAFAQVGIVFDRVRAAGKCRDEHLLVQGQVAPALNVLRLPPGEDKEGIEETRDRAALACVGAIHQLLDAGLRGSARLVDRGGQARTLEPGDIAVLVDTNDQAGRMQQWLARAGIPAVAAGRSSLYDSEEAQHLCWLLQAMLAPGDEQRMRAALATPLLGLDASALASLDSDAVAQRHWQDRMQHWRDRGHAHGPVALLGELCAENATRLLAWPDGERRLSNYLQLGEALQGVPMPGLAGVLAALEERMAEADTRSDDELLRLASDAERVKILTLHKSKGLEFEIVFLPFVATNGHGRASRSPRMTKFHDGTRRVALLFPEKGDPATACEAAEEHAEDIRVLYVGLTRARLATWLAWGQAKDVGKTALAWLLHRDVGSAAVEKISEAAISTRLALLKSRSPDAISLQDASTARQWAPLAFAAPEATPAPAVARRLLDRDWWVHSFSQLTREDSGEDVRGADDESPSWPDPDDARFVGSRFGNALHAALENVDFSAWLDWTNDAPPPGQQAPLAQALRDFGYGGAGLLDDGLSLLTRLVSETLNVPLPEGTRLAAVPLVARRNEMEFHLSLAPTTVDRLLALLHRHGIVAQRRAFGARRRLEGLLTGRIDLIYEASARYYVVDYKSNRLRDYGQASLDQAVRDSEYDLQYVLYVLALHRWLRFRLGPDYRPETHLGGVRYLFSRGLDRHCDEGPGIHAPELPIDLVLALDALLQERRT